MARKIQETWYRTETIDRAAMDDEKRTVELSFSSEHPVERYFGVEILDHSPASVDLSRLSDGGALLLNHDTDKQIGVVESARLDNRRGMAKVRFGNSALASEIYDDVKSGVRRLVSVGYRLTDRKLVEVSEEDGKETYRFKRWQPFEISIVPIPADPTVGVGRSNSPSDEPAEFELPPMKRTLLRDADPPNQGGGGAPPAVDGGKLERERSSDLRKLGKQFRGKISDVDDLVDEAIEKGTQVADFQRVLLNKISTSPIPHGSEPVERGEGTETGNSGGTQTTTVVRTLGEELVRAQSFKDFASKKSNRSIIEVRGSLPEHMKRATLTSSGLTSIQKIPGVILVDTQPLRVADLFAQGTTNSTTIRFTTETSYTNAATAVAEEGQKPEATFALGETDVTVKKLAVIGRVSDEALMDYEYMQSYVNGRLLHMIAEKEDQDLIDAAGGDSITGVLSVSGIQTQAYATNLADTIHKAITKVMSTPGFVMSPDAIVIHPTDWQNLVLTKDQNGQYYAGGPFTGIYGQGGIIRSGPWGLTPVVTTAIDQGTAIVGAFKVGAQIFRKSGITIESTNSDASDFQYNRICIRAEERLCLVPWRPKAFCKVTGIPVA